MRGGSAKDEMIKTHAVRTRRLCICSKPVTEVTQFSPWTLHEAMLYHRIYHYSFGLHVNHLVLLNSYMFGMFLLLASLGYSSLVVASLGCYALYVVALCLDYKYTMMLVLPYLVFLCCLAHGAWSVQEYLSKHGSLERWLIASSALGIVFSSFALQLIGHWLHEVFNAPPSLMHGFISAPVLEYVSLMWRLGFDAEESSGVLRKVEEIRERAFRSHSHLLFGASMRYS